MCCCVRGSLKLYLRAVERGLGQGCRAIREEGTRMTRCTVELSGKWDGEENIEIADGERVRGEYGGEPVV